MLPNTNETRNYIVLAIVGILAPLAHKYAIDGSTLTAIVTGGVAAAAALYQFYANHNMKVVPENSTAIHTVTPAPIGVTMQAGGTVVGAILLSLFVLVSDAKAQPATPAPVNSCDLKVILTGITFQNFSTRLKQCAKDDFSNAIKMATDNNYRLALACIVPASQVNTSITESGAITALVAFGLAKQAGMIDACNAWILAVGKL